MEQNKKESSKDDEITKEVVAKQQLDPRDEAISKLYTIRAGMSSIALAKKKIAYCDREKGDLRGNVDAIETKIKSEIGHNEDIRKKRSQLDAEEMQYKHKPKFGYVFSISWDWGSIGEIIGGILMIAVGLFVLYGIIVGVISLLNWITIINISDVQFGIMKNVAMWMGIAAGGAFVVSFIGYIIYCIVDASSDYKRKMFDYKKYSRKGFESFASIEFTQQLQNSDDKLVELRKKLAEENSKYEMNLKIKDNEIIMISKASKSIYDVLVKTFKNFLNPIDWENIDLAIYYLSTGRADTIKEALNLIDRQKQADAIVNELKNATTSIANEIRSNFATLGNIVTNNFNALSKQLENQHNQLLKSVDEMSTTLTTISGTLDTIKEQQKEVIESNKELAEATKKSISSLFDFDCAISSAPNVTAADLHNDLLYMQKQMWSMQG